MRDIASDEMVIYDIYLSETINRKISRAKLKVTEPLLSQEDIQEVYKVINTADITDTKVRKEHNQSILASKQEKQPTICNKPVSQKVKNYCPSK